MRIVVEDGKLRVYSDSGVQVKGVRSVTVNITDGGLCEAVLFIPQQQMDIVGVKRSHDGVRAG